MFRGRNFIFRIPLCITVLFFSLSVCGRKMVKMDKCERYYRMAMRTRDLALRMRYLKNAMAHADSKDQKVKIIIREAYTYHSLKNKELAFMTIEDGFKLRSLNSRLENQLISAKIHLSHWHDVRDEKLVKEALKLIYRNEFNDKYTLYFYVCSNYIRKKQYQKAFNFYKILERRAKRDSRSYHMALIQEAYIAGKYLKQIWEVKSAIRKMEHSEAPSDLLSSFYYRVGIAYQTTGDNKLAVEYFNKSIQNHSQAYIFLSTLAKGKILKETNKTEEALKLLKESQTLAKHPYHHYLAAKYIADIYIKEQKYKQAIEAVENSLTRMRKYSDKRKYNTYRGILLLKRAGINVKRQKNRLAASQYKNISKDFTIPKWLREKASKKYDYYSNIKIVEIFKEIDILLRNRRYEAALAKSKEAVAKSPVKAVFTTRRFSNKFKYC